MSAYERFCAVVLRGNSQPIGVVFDPFTLLRQLGELEEGLKNTRWQSYTAMAEFSQDLERRLVWIDLREVAAVEEIPNEIARGIEEDL